MATLGDEVKEVELLVNDIKASAQRFTPGRIVKAIRDQLLLLAAEGPIGEAWDTAWQALTAGTANYTKASEVERIKAIKLDSQGWILNFRGPEELEALREGTGTTLGDPTDVCLIENTSQSLSVRLFPTPNKTDTLHALVAVVPSDATASGDSILLSATMLKALEWFAASDLLGDDAPAAWRANAERILQGEKNRLGFQQAGSGFMPNML